MRKLFAAVVVVLAAGCSSAKKETPPPAVSSADFGRLQPGQMGPVDTARADRAQARDEVARAQLRLQEAQQEQGMAHADQTAAQAEIERAQVAMKAAKEAGDTRQLAYAEELTEAAQLRKQAADAHAEYAQKVLAARQADVNVAQARVAAAEAQLERSKLLALEQAGIPASSKYDPAPFDARVNEAQLALQQQQARARDADRAAMGARNRWQGLHDRYEARVQGIGEPALGGTGSQQPGAGTGAGPGQPRP